MNNKTKNKTRKTKLEHNTKEQGQHTKEWQDNEKKHKSDNKTNTHFEQEQERPVNTESTTHTFKQQQQIYQKKQKLAFYHCHNLWAIPTAGVSAAVAAVSVLAVCGRPA